MDSTVFSDRDTQRLSDKLRALGWVQDREGLWIDPMFIRVGLNDERVFSEPLADAVCSELGAAVYRSKK